MAISFVTSIERKNVVTTNFNGMSVPFSIFRAIFDINPLLLRPFTETKSTNRMNSTCSSWAE